MGVASVQLLDFLEVRCSAKLHVFTSALKVRAWFLRPAVRTPTQISNASLAVDLRGSRGPDFSAGCGHNRRSQQTVVAVALQLPVKGFKREIGVNQLERLAVEINPLPSGKTTFWL